MQQKNFATEENIYWKAARASGPGGQRVNKRSTKVQVWLPISSLLISDVQKNVLREKLIKRINKEDEIEVVCEEERSQKANKEKAILLLNEIIIEALRTQKKRIPTKPTKGSEQRFQEEKKKQAEKKQLRKFLPKEWLD